MEAPSTPVRAPTSELLLVSPLGLSTSSSLSRKRQATPSYEALSPKRIALIVRSGFYNPLHTKIQRPPGLGWPVIVQEAHIDAREPLFPNPLRLPQTPHTVVNQSLQPAPLSQTSLHSAPQPPLPQLLPEARQIVVPFDLRDDRGALQKSENREILMQIFPNTTGVGSDGVFLFIYVSEIPPKPWPKTIAGFPLYLAPRPGPEHYPMPLGLNVHPKNGTIADEMNGRDMEIWTPLFEAVRDHFLTLDISITQVMYRGNFLIIVLEHRGIDIDKLPWKAARIPCRYLYEDEMGKPRFHRARRQTDPTPGNPDQNQYDTLQPGMRVTSSYLPDKPNTSLATTTGILIKDNIGNEFMTVAAHGFPGECGTYVNHALPESGRKIGEFIYEVSHTDIGLVKLEPNEKFVNTTFESNITKPVRLEQLVRAHSVNAGDNIYLDTPDTGCISGTLLGQAYQRVPTDDTNSPPQHWVFTLWFYMGQGSGADLLAGMCGSAIWTEEGDVVGFFRYASEGGIMQDWCAGTAANELIDRGFAIVDTSGRE